MATTPKPTTGMLLDGCFATEAIDSSGEIVSITDMDVSTMEDGRGTVNYEHIGEDGGGFGRETVGKVVYVKKILKESDCENDRQREYYGRVKGIPFLYGVARLFDAAGHAGAQHLAAAIRDLAANDEPILLMWSIEGTTTKKDGNRIASSIARKVALTWKPCNKTAFSGILADPNAPAGFKTIGKAEHSFVDPEFARLGGSEEVGVIEPDSPMLQLIAAAASLQVVAKALTAGSPSGAPSSLSGGAALQREDILRSTALATLRDWGARKFERGEFKAFAKAKLPEVSDEFLDHFTDIAEAYNVKKTMMKAMPKPGKVPAVSSKKLAPVVAPKTSEAKHPVLEDISDEDEDMPEELVRDDEEGGKGMPRKLAYGTRRGVALTPNKIVRPTFDEKNGVLHTPAGSFQAYLPKHDGAEAEQHYQRILSHPDIEKAMDHAIGNWHKLHVLLKAGQLPPEVLMHAVMFSQLSPTKPVPVQEIQYARLVDAMDATGIDPRYPGFEDIERPYRNMDSPTQLPHTGREAFANNPAYYQGNKIGVEYDASGKKIGTASDETGRYPGELLSASPLFNDFMSRASQYHKLHGRMTEIMQKHRHDVMGAVGEMMAMKQDALRWSGKRRGAIKAGKPDPGPYQGQVIPGLKVKTGLYTWGMMGGGNSTVPDTHFVRNAFGLDVDKDSRTIRYLKNLFWRPANMDRVMTPFNQWYSKNHPAVEYTVNHPKWGSKFETRDDALFPSFWRHWLSIQPHERFLGMSNYSEQSGTNHAPYWEGIKPFIDPLVKGEVGSDVALRTALVHQQYVKDYGEQPAMFLFYHHLVPHLLEAAAHRERFGRDMQFLAKARVIEAGLVDLRKAVADALEPPKPDVPEVFSVGIKVGPRLHPAGRYMISNGTLHHLEDYHGILHSMLPAGDVDTVTVSRLHGMKWSPNFMVVPHPVPETPPPGEAQPELRVAPVQPPPAPVFEYQRPGMATPHVVEFGGLGAALDGKALNDAELSLILSNVENGLATLRYGRGMVKTEMDDETFEELLKSLEPDDALQQVRAAVKSGHLHPDVERALTKHIFTDPMVESVGNKYAWIQFQKQNRPGTYVSLDANNFKTVNDTHGHEAGDEAIRSVGGALRNASDKVGSGKLFRAGGDEFTAWFPSFEEAARFGRHVDEHLKMVPPIAGSHKLSVSMGFGPTFNHADAALLEAKKGKLDPATGRPAFVPGRTPNLAHSLVPGAEGPIKLHHEKPPAQSLPPPKVSLAQTALP